MSRALTIREFAKDLSVCYETVRRMIARGELPCLQVGNSIRIDPEVAKAHLAEAARKRQENRERDRLVG
ncbi:excisionase family DNA-binding protein [Pseudomonas sp. PDM21]|uniref:excisionase family DNA-binding protein n=1 Tax=Pseudomonas sp. PDM21 TaxID=2769257 RepID=UPI00178779C4|nr:helix-turn-helix domain-containing protein [Pseudomonas sp. PDM21]MBD9674916.1 excisionase family DNA-binding protein [Pseudomonas sp. PDM21]